MTGTNHVKPDIPMQTFNNRQRYGRQNTARAVTNQRMTNYSYDRLTQYGTRCDWLKDEKFLRDLEGDSVDTEILDEELRSLQDEESRSCRGRSVKILDSSPFQIVLCVLILVDAGVVIAEILLDLHAIRGEYTHAQSNLDRVLHFIRTEHDSSLYGYTGSNVGYILELLGKDPSYGLGAHANDSIVQDTGPRHRRFAHLYDSQFTLLPEEDGDFLAFQQDNDTLWNSTEPELLEAPPAPPVLSRQHQTPDSGSGSGTYYGDTASRLIRENVLLKTDIENMYALLDSGDCDAMFQLHQERRQRRDTHSSADGDRFPRSAAGGGAGASDGVDRSVVWLDENNNSVNSSVNGTRKYVHYVKHEVTQAELLHEIAHYLHFCSVAILGVFVLQVMLKLYGMGFEFFKSRMEVFDAVIIISSFVLDLVFMEGVGVDRGEEAAALLIMFLLWRILRVINGIMVTAKKRQEFRIKLQKRARRRAEKKIEILDEDKHMKEKEITALRELCSRQGALHDDIIACKPKKRSWIQRMDTSMGLTSVASLSLNLSMSMSGGMGAFTNMARSNPILSRRGSKEKLDGGSGGHTPAAGRSPALGRPDPPQINHIRPGVSSADHSPALRVSDRFNKSMASVEEEKCSDVSSEDSTSPNPRPSQNNFQAEVHIEHSALAVPKSSSKTPLQNSDHINISLDEDRDIMDSCGGKPNVTFLLENEVIPSPTDDMYDSREQQRLLLDLPSTPIPGPPSAANPVVPTVRHSPPSTPTSPSTITSLVSPTMSNGPVMTSDSLIDLESRTTSALSSPDIDGPTAPPGSGILMEVRNGSNSADGRPPGSYATASF